MKIYPFIVVLLIISIVYTTSAQDHKALNDNTRYSLGIRAYAVVVITRHKEYLANKTTINLFKTKGYVKNVNWGDDVDMRPYDTLKYGKDAVNGVIRFIVNDKKYPKAYTQVVKIMKYIGPAGPIRPSVTITFPH